MKKIFLILGLLLLSNLCYSQSKQITIIGNMPQANGGEYIYFGRPIGRYATSRVYIKSEDSVKVKNDKFTKILNFPTPGIVTLYEKPYNNSSSRFFAEPGDTIEILRQNGEIVFKGKNAIVNKMYSEIKIAPVGFGDVVFDIYKKNNNADKIIVAINNKEEEYIQHYNDLFLKKEISKSCLEYTKIMTEQSIDYMALMFAEGSKDENYRKEQKLEITEEGANKLIDYFNLKYIPYKSENLSSLIFDGLIKKNAMYLEAQAIKKNMKIPRFWSQFDEIFQKSDGNFGVIDYIRLDEYKERYIGSCFLELINSDNNDPSKNFKDLMLVFNAFAEKFPNSAYIIPLSESIMSLASTNLNTNNIKIESNISLGTLALYGKTLEPISNSPFAQPNQTFVNAIAERFPNQDLFIDFWATWCGPCIKQFSYNKDLHSFLDTKNIKTLYLSVDKEESKIKWEKYIQDYNLIGYHFLAENRYREKYLEPLGSSIPRYFAYNSKTKKLILLEGYPSEKEKFYAQIIKALKN